MDNTYRKCIEILGKLKDYSLKHDYYDAGDSVQLVLTRDGATSIEVMIQNSAVPEMDIKIGGLRWYSSLASPDELIKRISMLADDITYVKQSRSPLLAKKTPFMDKWLLIAPTNLKILKTTKVAALLPGAGKKVNI